MKAQLGEKGLCCETANVAGRIGASSSLSRADVVLFTVAGEGCLEEVLVCPRETSPSGPGQVSEGRGHL